MHPIKLIYKNFKITYTKYFSSNQIDSQKFHNLRIQNIDTSSSNQFDSRIFENNNNLRFYLYVATPINVISLNLIHLCTPIDTIFLNIII